MTYKDRVDAGKLLAFHLRTNLKAIESKDLVILGLPRGGVVVANELAKEFKSPLGYLVVQKIGHPDNPEYAAGAVSEQEIFLNPDIKLDPDYVKTAAQNLRQEITRKKALYDHLVPEIPLQGKIVILVDDGIATGLSMRVAIAQVRLQKPKKVYVAVPVGAADSIAELSSTADKIFCLYTPPIFAAVGQFYQEFTQTSDEQVSTILRHAHS